MMNFRSSARLLILLLAVIFTSSASTVTFLGAPGPNDGVDSVGPYNLTIDGSSVSGTCINFNLLVQSGMMWSATLISPDQLPIPEQQLALEAEYLNLQFTAGADWVPIHHAIWNLFGASYTDTGDWLHLAEVNYHSVDPSSFYLLTPDVPNYTQTFLVDAGFGNVTSGTSTPEASSAMLFTLIGTSLLCLGRVMRRRRARREEQRQELVRHVSEMI